MFINHTSRLYEVRCYPTIVIRLRRVRVLFVFSTSYITVCTCMYVGHVDDSISLLNCPNTDTYMYVYPTENPVEEVYLAVSER